MSQVNDVRRYTAVELRFVTNSAGDYVSAADYDALADKLAEQHQGEPIMLTAVAKLVDDGDGGLEASWLLEGGTSELFEGMLLLVAHNAPELCEEDGSAEVYTHADAGEVERLRAELEKVKADSKHLAELNDAFIKGQSEKLRAVTTQLAERDALLSDIAEEWGSGGQGSEQLWGRIRTYLSASAEPRSFRIPDCPDCACVQDGQCLCSPSKPSAEPAKPSFVECDACPRSGGCLNTCMKVPARAEPSAPVERDERAEFESWVTTRKLCKQKGAKLHKDRAGSYLDYRINDRWLTWQASAALERKP